MNENLYRLISDYQENIQFALKLLNRHGIKMPSSCNEWVEYKIPKTGELEYGIKYYKHGYGCRVELASVSIDFDFGLHGEVGGVNSWWLANFAGDKLETYGFKNCNDIYEYLEKALDDGELICTEQNLYYISNVPYTYAINTDSRNSEDILPSRNQDPVLTLHVHYFETADLMFRNYNKINKEMKFNDHLSQHNMIEMRIYFSTWLGFLGVVCEGFRKLNVRLLLDKDRPSNFKELLPVSDGIGKMMKEHSSLLRVFRNNVFHLRENTVFLNNFLDKEADFLPWASKLHMEFSSFFSQYTILCEAHYVINGRKGESGLIK